MPAPQTTTFTSQAGVVVITVNNNGTCDVYNAPMNTTVAITPQPGFGSVVKQQSSVSKSTALSQADSDLSSDGAV